MQSTSFGIDPPLSSSSSSSMLTAVLEGLSSQFLLPVDQITAALCLLLAFPFAFLLHFAVFRPKPCQRLINYLSIGPTYLFLYICFYVAREGSNETEKLSCFIWDLISIHLPVIFVYISLKYSKFFQNNPTIIFGLLLAQLSYHHISRQLNFYNQYTVNVTGPLMILIIKLSSFAYDVQADKIKIETVDFESFMAWCLLFAGFFTGPVVMFKDFRDFCHSPTKFLFFDHKKEEDQPAKEKEKSLDVKKMLKGRKRRATFLILSATFLLIFGLLLQPHFPIQKLLEISESSNNLLFRLAFLHLSLLSWRIKYYVAWSLAEGALVTIGLGFILKDRKIKW